jgi:hypothetical protein
MHLKDLKNMLNDMPEGSDDEIRNKLLISLYILQPPLKITFDNIILYLKKPKMDINNYFILRNKSCVLQINTQTEKKIIKYNKIHNPEIYRLLKLSFDKRQRLLLFDLNEEKLNDLFSNIIRERLNYNVNIDDLIKIFVNDLINSNYYKGMSSKQKEDTHKKIFGFTISKEYAKINLVEF